MGVLASTWKGAGGGLLVRGMAWHGSAGQGRESQPICNFIPHHTHHGHPLSSSTTHHGPLLLYQLRHILLVGRLLLQQLPHLALEHVAKGQRVPVLALSAVGALPEPEGFRVQGSGMCACECQGCRVQGFRAQVCVHVNARVLGFRASELRYVCM